MSEETKQKIREKKLGVPRPAWIIEKMRQANIGRPSWIKGKHLSEEQKEKLREFRLGKKLSEETKRKISEAERGEKNPFYGKKHSEETKRKISEANRGNPGPNKGKPMSEDTKRKLSEAKKGTPSTFKGKTHTKESKEKMRNAAMGRKHTKESRQKMSESRKGHIMPEITRVKILESHLGKSMSQSSKEKMSESMNSFETKCKLIEGKFGGLWYGAVRYYGDDLYCEKWNEDLKERVRAYWGYICFNCGTLQGKKKLAVHHIHYNKKTCCDGSPHDMVPLCRSCHGATNHNRDYWEDHLTELLYSYNPDGKCFFTREEMKSYLGE
jgi:NUMOD3 motif